MIDSSSTTITASTTSGRATSSGDYAFETRSTSKSLKRGLDVSVVVFALIVFLPLILTIVALLVLTQGRPILFRHHRVGRGGKVFPCFKFRTMAVQGDDILRRHLATNAEARSEWDETRKLKNDPRITPLGHILRKSSIDELPQFMNILRGEMSLVGPRPIVDDEIKYYGPHIQHYYRVRPGLTGAWQIAGRNDVSYSTRVQLDSDYVANWSFGRDLSILVKTVPAVLRSKGSY